MGSGIAAQRLSPNDIGLELLENSIATGAALAAIILAVGPVSGAHLNPAVSLADRLLGGLTWRETGAYWLAQAAPTPQPVQGGLVIAAALLVIAVNLFIAIGLRHGRLLPCDRESGGHRLPVFGRQIRGVIKAENPAAQLMFGGPALSQFAAGE